jgi:hypothetical protein
MFSVTQSLKHNSIEAEAPPYAVYAKYSDRKPYLVANHGPEDVSQRKCGGHYWPPSEPMPTRRERELHRNFLGWTWEPESQWTADERRFWREAGRAYLANFEIERQMRAGDVRP